MCAACVTNLGHIRDDHAVRAHSFRQGVEHKDVLALKRRQAITALCHKSLDGGEARGPDF